MSKPRHRFPSPEQRMIEQLEKLMEDGNMDNLDLIASIYEEMIEQKLDTYEILAEQYELILDLLGGEDDNDETESASS
ncbi:hypothetical protein [Geomicrobium sediminis]|uniref:Uncharacterized protein n=1 Tax=Geomicrobium sediminis TaxID=1347788 RepID=A0ABS2PGE8_9BACL|nr:hypothetical protein [Geomicrobium sediminis]MBM7634090.1 hypothetical protein [Geomicrobium sediminis]